jgi:hypothetical protein
VVRVGTSKGSTISHMAADIRGISYREPYRKKKKKKYVTKDVSVKYYEIKSTLAPSASSWTHLDDTFFSSVEGIQVPQ